MRGAKALLLSCVFGACLPANAFTLTDVILQTLPANVGSVNFSTPASPGTVMTVTETTTATMRGSAEVGYEGLWLGSDQTGGRYTFAFNRPVSSVTFSIVALTAFFGGGAEALNTFVSNNPTTATFTSADGSANWNGTVLTAIEEDSRALLTFSTTAPAGFSSIRFDHVQPEAMQGFVIDQVDFLLAAIPEPTTALLFTLGLIGIASLVRRAHRDA
jgi:acyl-CoA hydrolase